MTQALTLPAAREQRSLVRALERRFGQSVMPYEFRHLGRSAAEGPWWRVTDVETGSYVEGVFHLYRLHVRRIHDGTAVSAKAA